MRRLFLLAFIWGWSFLFIKVILEDAPPTFLAWGRIVLGLAVLAVAMRHRGERLPERRYWGHLLVLGLAMSVLPFMLIGWGEEHISSALASVLNACTPLFAAGFAAGLLGERLRPPQLAGIAVGFLGVAVVAGVGGGDLAGSSLLGSAAVVLAGAGYGFGFAYANRFTTGLSALQLSFGQLLAGTLVLAPVAAVDVAAGRVALGPMAALCLVLLGTLGTGYAYLLNYRTLQESGATVASLVTYLVPLVAVAAGVLVLGEPFTFRLVLGGLIVVVGVALVQGRLFSPRQAPQPVPGPPAPTERPAGHGWRGGVDHHLDAELAVVGAAAQQVAVGGVLAGGAGPIQVRPADVDQGEGRGQRVDGAQLGPDADQALGAVGVGGAGEGGLDLGRLADRDGGDVPDHEGREGVAGGDARQVAGGQGRGVAVQEGLDVGERCGVHGPDPTMGARHARAGLSRKELMPRWRPARWHRPSPTWPGSGSSVSTA